MRSRKHGQHEAYEPLFERFLARVEWPLPAALTIAIALWAFLVGLSGIDYVRYADRPVERAVVVEVSLTGERTDCGRTPLATTDEEVVTYRSANPPPGMSATFTWRGCPTDEQVGDVVTAVRLGDNGEHVYRYPIASLGQLLTWLKWFVIGAFSLAFAFLLLRREGMAWWNRSR